MVASLWSQVDPKRLITDQDASVWLRTEDGGYMDSEGRIWLMGRVKWRVERGGKTYWPTDVEQKVGRVGLSDVCVCLCIYVCISVCVCMCVCVCVCVCVTLLEKS